MDKTTITLHSDYHVGEVDPRIFGGFLEHMGRCVEWDFDLPPLAIVAITCGI